MGMALLSCALLMGVLDRPALGSALLAVAGAITESAGGTDRSAVLAVGAVTAAVLGGLVFGCGGADGFLSQAKSASAATLNTRLNATLCTVARGARGALTVGSGP